ncbi:MAG: hypothetical protein ABI432_04750 [Flavobacteriales bacterium]
MKTKNDARASSAPLRTSWSVLFLTSALAFCTCVATAQNGQPVSPPPPPTIKDPQSPQPPRPGQSPVHYDNKGWVVFDQQAATGLEITPSELERLQEIDRRYQQEYLALGDDPTHSEGYQGLLQRREREVEGVLTAPQYQRWHSYDVQKPQPTMGQPSRPTESAPPR